MSTGFCGGAKERVLKKTLQPVAKSKQTTARRMDKVFFTTSRSVSWFLRWSLPCACSCSVSINLILRRSGHPKPVLEVFWSRHLLQFILGGNVIADGLTNTLWMNRFPEVRKGEQDTYLLSFC